MGRRVPLGLPATTFQPPIGPAYECAGPSQCKHDLVTDLVTQFRCSSPKIHQFFQVQTPFSLAKSSIVTIFPRKILGKSIISSIFPRKTPPFRCFQRRAPAVYVATGPRRRREAKPGRQSSGSTWRFTKKRRSPSVNPW